MKTSKALYELIHSLTKAEKRHFKLRAGKYAKNKHNNYVILFDALEKQSTYNEQKLIRKLVAFPFAQKLPKTSYLLYDFILKTQVQLHQGKSSQSKVDLSLEAVDYLFYKNLYQQSFDLLVKTEKNILPIENPSDTLNIVCKKIQLYPYLKKGQCNLSLSGLFELQQKISVHLSIEMQYKRMAQQLEFHYDTQAHTNTLSSDLTTKKIELVLQELALPCPTFLSKVYYYLCQAYWSLIQSKGDEAIQNFQLMLDTWDLHPHLKTNYSDEFLLTISNYILYDLNVNGKEVDYDCILESIRVLPPISGHSCTKASFLITILEFIINVHNKKEEHCKIQLFSIQEILQKNALKLLPQVWSVRLYYYLCIFNFMQEDFQEAIEWADKILLQKNIECNPTMINYCQLIKLMARYELEEFGLLEYEIRKTYRFLKHQKRINIIELEILQCVKKLIQLRYVKDHQQFFNKMNHSIVFFNQSKHSVFCNPTPDPLYDWIKNKISDEQLN